MSGQLRWFTVQGTAGLYVVEYRGGALDGAMWVKWYRGFWSIELILTVTTFSLQIADPFGKQYLPLVEVFPEADLAKLAKGLRGQWSSEPPADFFATRFPPP